ncbi:MAG: TIR domain-containing protein [Clostridiales bacterium]|nr:TIR domain-containing protein [Clostridiales bacterium]
MAIIKCKMCGGDLVIEPGSTVAECEYCGSRQTVPTADNEKKLTLFARANRLRSGCEFDKAAGVYESIVADFPEEAEAYWGLVLCKYGIEYVDDPATGKKIPTCHRSSFDSILEDSDFEQALENADAVARKVYREEAKQIEEIRKGIIEVSGREQPYDIFICYKETDENGQRTIDSAIAQDVYDALTAKDYRVFFSRITLEDKLGQEYEPYIFAALNSAKIMLAFGTDYEYFNAVWVKNEWSRFLKLMASDKSKHLIPCYKNIDAYDMPREFAKLQAQDMGKVGAIQDLLRGIEKLLPRMQEAAPQQKVIIQQTAGGSNAQQLLKRGYLALEDGEWNKADGFFEEALNQDAECAEAYLGKLMADLRVRERTALGNQEKPFDHNGNYQKVIRFGSEPLRAELTGDIDAIVRRQKRIEQERLEQEERQRQERLRFMEISRQWRSRYAPAQNMIGASGRFTVGLKADGTVVATGDNAYGACNVSGWKDIVAISAGSDYTVGLKADGTVVAVGWNEYGQCDVSGWKDIVAISAESFCTVGLKADGTVVAVGDNGFGRCDVSGWKDIVDISAGWEHTVGLKADGTVVAVGWNKDGRCKVSAWGDIVAISAGDSYTVGLKADGTVVAVGSYYDVSGWKDIVAISAGGLHTVGLKADGTVVAVGDNKYGQCDVSGWKLFQNIETIEAEREEARKREEQRREEAREREEQRRAKQKALVRKKKGAGDRTFLPERSVHRQAAQRDRSQAGSNQRRTGKVELRRNYHGHHQM